ERVVAPYPQDGAVDAGKRGARRVFSGSRGADSERRAPAGEEPNERGQKFAAQVIRQRLLEDPQSHEVPEWLLRRRRVAGVGLGGSQRGPDPPAARDAPVHAGTDDERRGNRVAEAAEPGELDRLSAVLG